LATREGGADGEPAAPAGAAVPSHLRPLRRREWALWGVAALRSAGFPVAGVLRLATPGCAAAADALADLRPRDPAPARAVADFREAVDAAGRALAVEIREIVADGRFREALLWQNRDAFHTGVSPLARAPGPVPRNARYRRAEELVASYWQRYCVKNDTTGFVGPTAWAYWSREHGAAGIQLRVGSALLAGCRAYFEVWGMEALARAIAREPGCALWMRPRRMPFVHVDGTTLFQPNRPPEALPEALAVLLAACDGRRTARELAADLGAGSEPYELLESLRQRRLISWTLDVPVQTHPERHLRALFEDIGRPDLREDALSRLDRLERCLDEVRASAGDAGRLDDALGRLNAVFTEVTGAAPTRSPGAVHRGRTLVYHECLRDVDLTIGPDVLRALDQPLGLLLASARWLTYELAARCWRILDEVFAALSTRTGFPEVDFPTLWFAALPRLRDGGLAREVRRELQRRWAAVLAVPPDRQEVVYRSAEIGDAVRDAFAAPGAGWPGARYHTPDLLLEASAADAIGRGRYRIVLGELHVAINALRHASFVDQHPSPAELFAALDSDIPEPRVVPVPPRQGAWGTSRGHQGLVSSRDWRISFLHDLGGYPESRSLPMGALLVERRDGDLVVRARDRDLTLGVIEVFGDSLTDLAYDLFDLFEPSPHTPRIVFDQVVVSRERWCFRGPELAFARERDEAARFLAARRWWRAHGLPRFAFARTPGEKAIYVDFDSLPYVNLLARAVRRVDDDGHVELTEMLPGHDASWLADAGGGHYTSELRTIAVDRGRVATAADLASAAGVAGAPGERSGV
jgi:Lantibiotic dehydratase, N terminus